MSFLDIINQEQKRLEASNNNDNDKVKYPQSKHKRLFFDKDNRDLYMQVLPAGDLVNHFASQFRKIFLTAKSSTGKDVKSNFVLDPQLNEGSLLERKIQEWASRGMIPSGFGGQQSPKTLHLVNVVRVVVVNGQWVQERDEQGNLVVRLFEMPHSAYTTFISKLGNKLLNPNNLDLSFIDPNHAHPVQITKPRKGEMSYAVEVYSSILLPPLGQGWENQLENLAEHVVPTERLENGQKWVQAFIDMKEGRKPNSGGQAQAENVTPPVNNPYAQTQQAPYGGQQAPQQPNPYAQQTQQPNPYAQTQQAPYGGQQPPSQPSQQQQQQYSGGPFNSYNTDQQAPQQQYQAPQPNTGGYDALPEEMSVPNQQMPPQGVTPPQQSVPQPQAQMPTQQQTPPPVTQQQYQAPPAPQPTQNANSLNANGLMDIDAMLENELGNGSI
jgi:hypothetical protein